MTAPRRSGPGSRTYVAGYAVSLLLTAAAFAVVYLKPFPAPTMIGIVFALGLVQMVVHFRFFLHIGLGKRTRDDLQLVLFSAVIVALMVAGTLVLLCNLRGRMM